MIEYPKIQTVYLRDSANRYKTLLEGMFAMPEFEYLAGNEWEWQEMVDGTNIRVQWGLGDEISVPSIRFRGRTDKVQLPPFLLTELQEMFSVDKFIHLPVMTLYGEGYGCLSYGTSITLANGDKRPIGVIVNQKEPHDVLTYNLQAGRLESGCIIAWKRSPPTDDWLTIHYSRCFRGGRNTGIVVTPNHGVFIKRKGGIVCCLAKDLVVGDALLVPMEKLRYYQKQFVLGSLLGDGSLQYKSYTCAHTDKQSEYTEFIARLLSSVLKERRAYISGYGFPGTRLRTKSLGELYSLQQMLYCGEGGKKRLTSDYLYELHAVALAAWYMDDGTLNIHPDTGHRLTCTLCTDGFLEEDVGVAIEWFRKHGFDCYKKQSRGHPRIVFTPDGTVAFQSVIAPFVIRQFDYKLLPHLRTLPRIWDSETIFQESNINLITTKITGIEFGNPYAEQYRKVRYDIEIEKNKNYFANNVLVHNSRIQKGGGNYIPDGVGFILFDVRVDDLWLKREDVRGIALRLGIDSVPVVGYGTLREAVELARVGFQSRIGTQQQLAEGLVMRPEAELLTCRGQRIIAKIKHKDFL